MEKDGTVEYSSIQDESRLREAVAFCEKILGANPEVEELYGYEAWRKRLGKYSSLLLCAVGGDRVVSAVLGRPENEESLVMGQVACEEEYRGRGITRELVRRFEQNAKAMGFSYITLGARPEAEGFYKKCGYRQIGEIEGQKIYQKMLK